MKPVKVYKHKKHSIEFLADLLIECFLFDANVMKKSFILHNDSLSVIDKMSDEQVGKLFRMMKSYNYGNDYVCNDFAVELVFEQFKNQFDRDYGKYDNICERNKKIADDRRNKNSTKSTSRTSGKTTIPNSTKNTDSDSDNKNDNDSDNKNDNTSLPEEKKEVERFIDARNKIEVFKHCNKLTVDIEKEREKIRKKYTKEDIGHGLKEYRNDCNSRTEEAHGDYANHRFSVFEFLKQANGLTKYINM